MKRSILPRMVAASEALLGAALAGIGLSVAIEDPGEWGFPVAVLFAGCWLGVNALAILHRSRVLVVLLSTPAFLISLLWLFMLLFAPLAWGPSNLILSYGLLAGALVAAALQAAAVVTVFLPSNGPRSGGTR